eukprot:GEZU01011584.1.p1 GENE.GEZU01011584.1~~GEZU01011584.1.p1  ORF type:complete len:140 (-),score=12.96 GEZU01011584.1:375-794(-)
MQSGPGTDAYGESWLPTFEVDRTAAVIALLVNIFLPCVGSIIAGAMIKHKRTMTVGIILTVGFWLFIWVVLGIAFYIAGIVHGVWLLTNRGIRTGGNWGMAKGPATTTTTAYPTTAYPTTTSYPVQGTTTTTIYRSETV